MKRKYLKVFATGEEEKAKEYAKEVNGYVKHRDYVTGVRRFGMAAAVDSYYVYPKKKKENGNGKWQDYRIRKKNEPRYIK